VIARALAIACLILALIAGAQSYRLAREMGLHAQTIAEHATARANAIQQAREQEQRYVEKIAFAVHIQAQRAAVAEAAAVRAADAVGRLRERAKAAASRVPGDPTTAGSSEADRIADALTALAEAGGRTAAAADRAIIAGQACQDSFPVK
jgi:Protein of unknown function (DUF2514)